MTMRRSLDDLILDDYDPEDIEDSLDSFYNSLYDDTLEPDPLEGEGEDEEDEGDIIDPNGTSISLGDYTVGGLNADISARRAEQDARARERMSQSRERLAQSRARFDDWLTNLPLREADKEELRQRRQAQEDRAMKRLEMATRAEERAIERLNMSRQDREIRLTKPFITQPKPLPAPVEPKTSSQERLSWEDISLFLESNEEEALIDAWSNGGSGVGMLSALRLRQLMSNLPIDSNPSSFLRRLRAMWSRSGTRRSVSRAPRLTAPPRPPASGSTSPGRPIRQTPSPRILPLTPPPPETVTTQSIGAGTGTGFPPPITQPSISSPM